MVVLDNLSKPNDSEFKRSRARVRVRVSVVACKSIIIRKCGVSQTVSHNVPVENSPSNLRNALSNENVKWYAYIRETSYNG